MPSYSIPSEDLSAAIVEAGISPVLGDIKLLWKQHIKYGAKPTTESYMIYNALQGKNLYHGIDGKSKEKYLFQKLAGHRKTIPHPWFRHLYTLRSMQHDLLDMITPTPPIFVSVVKAKRLNKHFAEWFAPYKYRCAGETKRERRTNRNWPGIHGGSVIPLIKLLMVHFERAEEELKNKIHVEHYK